MKLLFILSEYLPESGGGIISYYAGVLPHLVRAGHEVDVLVASADAVDRPSLDLDGVAVSYLRSGSLEAAAAGFGRFDHGYPSFRALLPVAWAAYHQVNGGVGHDLVETTDFPMLYAPWVSQSAALPVNISLHGSPGQVDWHDHPGNDAMDGELMRAVERAAFGSVHGLQANSDANARFWGRLTRREIPVLPPAHGDWQATGDPVQAGRHGGLVVGRLQRWKGPRVLCEAMRLLPGLEIGWIGRDVTDPASGEAFSKLLRDEFPDIFGVRLHHEQSVSRGEVRRRIAAADFLCVPSTWDVFNLTVVEAMECGTPVICSNEAGASMLLRHGENGFLFDPAQPHTLATAIRDLHALDAQARRSLIRNARETLVAQLDPGRLAVMRAAYYSELVTRWAPSACDDWLAAVLSPRPASATRARDILRSFTTRDLLKAACRQFAVGVERRIRITKS